MSEFASVKEQAYEGRKAKSEADLRAVEKSSLSLSLFSLSFFCDYSPSSNFFQHEERSCLFRDTSLFPKVSLSREFLPFLSFFFLFFSIASFKHRLEFPSFIT